MFTRKISPQSFDDSLGEYHPHSHLLNDEELGKPSSKESSHQFDPQTGEILEGPTLHRKPEGSAQRDSLNRHFSQFKQEKLKLANSSLFLFLPIHLILSISMTYLITTYLLENYLFKNQQFQIEQNSQLLSELKRHQISSIDALHEIQENMNESFQEAYTQNYLNNDLAFKLEDTLEAVLQKNLFKHKKNLPSNLSHQKATPLKNIKYLGSIRRHDKLQVLIDIDSVIKHIQIGEIIGENWRLAEAEPQKITLATPDGQSHIITLDKGVK